MMLSTLIIFARNSVRLLLVCGLIMSTFLAGCTSVNSAWNSLVNPMPKPVTVPWQSLVISASLDANLNSPVTVDVLFIGTAELQKNFQEFNANKWFAGRENALSSFPYGLKLISLELVPGQTLKISKTELSKLSALEVVVFANYATPGDHKKILDLDKFGYVINLESRSFKVSAVPGSTQL